MPFKGRLSSKKGLGTSNPNFVNIGTKKKFERLMQFKFARRLRCAGRGRKKPPLEHLIEKKKIEGQGGLIDNINRATLISKSTYLSFKASQT